MKEFLQIYAEYMVILFVMTYISYVYIMRLRQKRDEGRLPSVMAIMIYPVVILGVIYDVLFNIFVGSVMFIELPQEWLFTARLKRIKKEDSWKAPIAKWFCTHLLNPHDPGHC